MPPNDIDSLTRSQKHARRASETRLKLVPRLLYDLWAGRMFAVFALLPSILLFLISAVLIYRAWPILSTHSLQSLLLGQLWRPSAGAFGFLPFIVGSLAVTAVALVLAVPVCLLSAIYLSEYAHPLMRLIARPVLDILAGIPSVIYGLWGVLVIVPWVQDSLSPVLRAKTSMLHWFTGSNPTGYSVLAAGLVLAVMVAPFIINLVFEILQTVPAGLKEASLAVGSTHWQTIHKVIIPSIRSGVLAAIVLGTSRALGETMAVMMVVGNVPKIPTSIFDPAYPLPALIANSYGEMLSIPLYDSALMSAALFLLVIILIFNLVARFILRRYSYRESLTI
jgi:phosphate transport system permease protein